MLGQHILVLLVFGNLHGIFDNLFNFGIVLHEVPCLVSQCSDVLLVYTIVPILHIVFGAITKIFIDRSTCVCGPPVQQVCDRAVEPVLEPRDLQWGRPHVRAVHSREFSKWYQVACVVAL